MGSKALLYVALVIALLGGAIYGYTQYAARHAAAQAALTAEGKAYARNLKLSDIELKASENYFQQRVVEIDGKIANAGDRPLSSVEIYCLFHDTYGQLVLRQRLSIVSPKMGGLKPGDTKSFRLPFDDLPGSWNQAMPQLVIAAVNFS